MEDQFQPAKSELNNLSIKEIFFKYIKFLPFVILSVVLALLGAFIYLRYATPIYQSAGSIVINVDNSNTSSADNDKFQKLFVGGSKDISNEIEVLRSRPLMEKVVEDLNLNFSYYAKGKIKERNIYNEAPFQVNVFQLNDSNSSFTLKIDFTNPTTFTINDENKPLTFEQVFKNQWGTFSLSRKPSKPLSNEYRVVWQPSRAVAGNLVSNLLVAPKGPAGILIISLEATHPQLAADVINELMKEYQITTITDKNETTRKIIAFIDDRLKVVSKELDSVTGSLLSYQQSHDMLDPESQSTRIFSKADEAELKITDQQTQINIVQLIDNYLSDSKNAFDLVPSTLGISDPTLSGLIAAYNTAQLERKNLIDANVPATNPKVVQLGDRIENLRVNIFENLRNLKNSYQASINRLQQQNNIAQEKLKALPEKEQNLQEIRKEQQAKQALYNLLNEKREESAISLAGTISNTKVLDQAGPNGIPVKPNRKTIQLIAIVIGLAIPALIIFLIEILNDKVRSRADIERVTPVPIIGEIGHSYSNNVLVVDSNNRSIIAEQFRIIRSNLQYVLTNLEKPVLLVTSSFSGEGKSFVTANLGAVMALANKKTIILEFDIRKPKILSHLGITKKPGLTNFLLGKVKAEELPIHISGFDNLYVLACGPVPPNPSELLLEPRLTELFAYLKENFDMVVMDTAPIGMVSDAMSLSRFADSTLYIVRQDHTLKKQVGLIDSFHESGKLPRISIVLNDAKLNTGYGYYGKSYYGYGYGAGYFDEELPPPGGVQRWLEKIGIKQKKKSSKV